jgi:membrane protease YdiL (CAAX protease family)
VTDEPELQEREERWPDGALKARWAVIIRPGGAEEPHGPYVSFHANGMQSGQGQYAYGEKIGQWKRWDETGTELPDEPVTMDLKAVEGDPQPWGTWTIELLVVLALAWLAPLVTGAVSLWSVWDMPDFMADAEYGDYVVDDGQFAMSELPLLAMHLQIFIPVLYICWRSDLGWRQLGVVRPELWGLLLLGPLLAVLTLGTDALLYWLFEPSTPWFYFAVPGSVIGWSLLVVTLIANSLAEEFVWRGFVLQRLKQMSGSAAFALVLSSFLFATYHMYQGFGNAALVMTSGLIWGASVLITKRIWPAVVGHTLHNIVVYSPIADWLFV